MMSSLALPLDSFMMVYMALAAACALVGTAGLINLVAAFWTQGVQPEPATQPAARPAAQPASLFELELQRAMRKRAA